MPSVTLSVALSLPVVPLEISGIEMNGCWGGGQGTICWAGADDVWAEGFLTAVPFAFLAIPALPGVVAVCPANGRQAIRNMARAMHVPRRQSSLRRKRGLKNPSCFSSSELL